MREGWEMKKLGEVCEKITDGTHQTPKYFDSGYIFLSSKNVTSGTINWDDVKYLDEDQHNQMQKRVSPQLNDILLAKNGTTGIGAMVDREIPFDIYVSLALLRPSTKLSPQFLLHFINSPIAKNQFNKRLKGIGVPNLHLNEIREVKISYPKLLSEQQYIVSILDKTFAAIDEAKANTEKNLNNAKELFQSQLNKIFSQKGEGWEEKKLGEVCEMKPPKREARDKLQEDDLVSFVPMEDLGIEVRDVIPIKEKTLKAVMGSYTYFADGDLLLAKITPCFENGKIGIAQNLKNGIGFGSSEYIVFRSNGEVNQELLYYFLSRKSFREQGRSLMTGAVGHKRVSKDWIENYLLPFPKSLKEQQKIVSQLNALSAETKKLEAHYQKKSEQLEDLKKSILDKAFKGELIEKEITVL